jgi:uncharacterized protein (TIGR02996 family)
MANSLADAPEKCCYTKRMRDLLEHSIAARPDDPAAHAAYADFLAEEGDPRGEFIQVQLALEDESRPPQERARLRGRERDLLREHRRTWLGDLAPLLIDGAKKLEWYGRAPQIDFRRGWLDRLEVGRLTVDLGRALADSPLARMLRELAVEYVPTLDEQDFTDGPDVPRGGRARTVFTGLTLLANTDGFTNLRRLRFGEELDDTPEDHSRRLHDFGSHIASFVARLPRLQELRLNTAGVDSDTLFALPLKHLRHLQVYGLAHYPLRTLADNPVLRHLKTLRLFPRAYSAGENRVGGGSFLPAAQVRALVTSPNLPALGHLQLWGSDMGDEGIVALVESGMLGRLRTLDLSYGCVTDAGAGLLASCPELPGLERLALRNNWLTDAGVAVLRATGVPLDADPQLPEGDDEFLYAGEIE